LAQCEYLNHTPLGGREIAQFFVRYTALGQKNHNMHRRTSFDATRRCAFSGFVSLGHKNHNIDRCDAIRFASRCAISGFVSLGQKVTTCIIAPRAMRFDSPVDVRYRFLYLLARKSQHASSHIDRCDAILQSMCDIWFCPVLYLLAKKKSQRASSHIDQCDSIRQSMCDIGFCISCPEKITCIIAHRPMRFASRCAISGFVSLGHKNHNMHHRTSPDAVRQSMCDIWFCISWP
jgi:hypothetical protein